jgi:hypothetical protein
MVMLVDVVLLLDTDATETTELCVFSLQKRKINIVWCSLVFTISGLGKVEMGVGCV